MYRYNIYISYRYDDMKHIVNIRYNIGIIHYEKKYINWLSLITFNQKKKSVCYLQIISYGENQI